MKVRLVLGNKEYFFHKRIRYCISQPLSFDCSSDGWYVVTRKYVHKISENPPFSTGMVLYSYIPKLKQLLKKERKLLWEVNSVMEFYAALHRKNIIIDDSFNLRSFGFPIKIYKVEDNPSIYIKGTKKDGFFAIRRDT